VAIKHLLVSGHSENECVRQTFAYPGFTTGIKLYSLFSPGI